jgi:hypothetical protein
MLNILVLHKLGDPQVAPHFLRRHVFSLRNNYPEHNYLYHDCHLPVPDWIKEIDFDAILLDVTLLCIRWAPADTLRKHFVDLEFVKKSSAFKIAMPQDEYDCSQILDDWMVDWKVDVVYSVLTENHEILYPRYCRVGSIKVAYTGYLDESTLGLPCIPFEKRRIDIGYRARKLPAYFGRIGFEKEQVGLSVIREGSEHPITLDVKLGFEHSLFGNKWLEFLANSKFTLGSNSGSSLMDPVGAIRRKVYDFVWRKPDASFEEIEAACFPGQDGRFRFTAISPRILEAAVMESCQILVPGTYSGILKPFEHYIPMAADGSDFGGVLEMMSDLSSVQRMIKKTKEAVLDHPLLRYSNQSSALLGEIVGSAGIGRNKVATDFASVLRRYDAEVSGQYKRIYLKQRLRSRLISKIDRHPRLSSFIRSMYLGVSSTSQRVR